MWKIREIQDKVTNVVMNYTEVESKVREATNDDQWGPHGSMMNEIAKYTYTYENFPEVMGMLWKRMLHEKKYWRRTYKCLLLLSYLIRNGSERVVSSARDHIYDMRQLESYQHVDEFGKDQGLNIRHKVKEVLEIIQDDVRLRDERKRAKGNRDKYIGMSSDVIEDSFYSDRYNREPNQSPNMDSYGGGGSRYNNADDFNRKNPFQQIKETIDNIRPGKRDYSEYNKPQRANTYHDEPENGVEAGEDEYHRAEDDGDDDTFKYKPSSTSSLQDIQTDKIEKPVTKSPTRKIDLGAAANLANQTPVVTKPVQTNNADFADFQSMSNAQQPPAAASAMDELADILTTPLPAPSLVPLNSLSSSTANQVDLFGDFNSPAPTIQTQQPTTTNNDFANFESFDSISPASSSNNNNFGNFGSLSSMSAPQNTSNFNQTNPMQSNTMQFPQQNMMMSQQNMMNQQNLMMTSQPGMMNQQNMGMNGNMMSSNQGMMQNQSMMKPQQNMNTPMSNNKKTMWANTGGVDISLDSLTPGASREKAPLPSMNQLSHTQPAYGMTNTAPIGMAPQQYNMQTGNNMMPLQTGMNNMNLGNSPMRMQGNAGMRPNTGMQMPNMGMQMGMTQQQQMGFRMNMQPMASSNMNMNQNFAQFKAS